MPDLYLASTPLTALIAAGVARAEGGAGALVLIEDYDDAPRWRALFEQWRDSPFARVELVPGRATENRSMAHAPDGRLARRLARERVKRALRDETLARLRALDRTLAPLAVYIGNDRRPETQYALHLASARGARPGVYLDDGLFTYVGDAHDRPFARRVDAFLKRRLYGSWWEGLPQVGTSRFVREARLAYPELARDADPARRRTPLSPSLFATRAMARLARDAWRAFAPGAARLRIDTLLLLPHTRLFRDGGAPLERLGRAIARLGRHGTLAVKYHPREAAPDPLGLADEGARLLPHGLPAELAFTHVRRGGRVLGEASTVLLAARFLRPDLDVLDLAATDVPFAKLAQAFLAARGVAPVAL